MKIQLKGYLTKNNIFAIIFSRNGNYIKRKIKEFNRYGIPFIIICGKEINHKKVVYRPLRGKYDAINFAYQFIPKQSDIIILNDEDTFKLPIIELLSLMEREKVDFIFPRILILNSLQTTFTILLDKIRKFIPITANGELIILKKEILDKVYPLKPCKAEDSYMMFKALEYGYKIRFAHEYAVITYRNSKSLVEEINYKKRTVTGIYQALSYSNPPLLIKLFYIFLPFISILLLFLGKKFHAWGKGIILGFINYYIFKDKGGSY